jgi:hypothetical protein
MQTRIRKNGIGFYKVGKNTLGILIIAILGIQIRGLE